MGNPGPKATTPGPSEPGPGPAGAMVIAEAQRRLDGGDYTGAVLGSFPIVMVDVQRAYGIRFLPHWTARDVLAHGLRTDMGTLPDALRRLYELYEPVRYGQTAPSRPGDLIARLRDVYEGTALWSLPADGSAAKAPGLWTRGRAPAPDDPGTRE